MVTLFLFDYISFFVFFNFSYFESLSFQELFVTNDFTIIVETAAIAMIIYWMNTV